MSEHTSRRTSSRLGPHPNHARSPFCRYCNERFDCAGCRKRHEMRHCPRRPDCLYPDGIATAERALDDGETDV